MEIAQIRSFRHAQRDDRSWWTCLAAIRLWRDLRSPSWDDASAGGLKSEAGRGLGDEASGLALGSGLGS